MRLTRTQIEQLVNITGQNHNGTELYGTCPYCHQDEWHISLTKDNHPFSCYRKVKCGISGNLYTLLKYLGKTKDYINERPIEQTLSSFEEEEKETALDLSLTAINTPLGWKRVVSIADDDYLASRGFTDELLQKLLVGRSRFKKGYVTFLVTMNGIVTGYVSRSVKDKAWIDAYNQTAERKHLRYDNSPSDFNKMLYGYDELVAGETTDVILVEGIFSKAKTDLNLGLDTDNWLKCVATFGAKVSAEQVELLKLKGISRVWLWHEADVINKVKKNAIELSKHFDVKVNYLDGFDPADINSEQAFNLLERSVSFVEINVNYI